MSDQKVLKCFKQAFFQHDQAHEEQGIDTGIGSPFEFRALEALLVTMNYQIEQQLQTDRSQVKAYLERVRKNTTTTNLERLRQVSTSTDFNRSRIIGIHDAIQTLLKDDLDMANMYLGQLQRHPLLWERQVAMASAHEEIECLLEHYLESVDFFRTSYELILGDINSSINVLEIELDASRNKYLKTDLLLNAVSVSFGMGSMLAGAFGMNLTSGHEDSPYWFWTVFGCICGQAIVMVLLLYALFWRYGIL